MTRDYANNSYKSLETSKDIQCVGACASAEEALELIRAKDRTWC